MNAKLLLAPTKPRIFKIDYHQQKLSNLSIACDVRLEGALYSVFSAEPSKRPWTSLNEVAHDDDHAD